MEFAPESSPFSGATRTQPTRGSMRSRPVPGRIGSSVLRRIRNVCPHARQWHEEEIMWRVQNDTRRLSPISEIKKCVCVQKRPSSEDS